MSKGFTVEFGPSVKRLGFEIAWEGDVGRSILAVKPGSEAEKLGLRAGDLLLSVGAAGPLTQANKAVLQERPLQVCISRPTVAEASGSDSGSESDGQKVPSVTPDRHRADLALIAGKAPKQAQAPAAPAAAGRPTDSDGEDSAEEPASSNLVTPDRFDRDMDLLHRIQRQGGVPGASKGTTVPWAKASAVLAPTPTEAAPAAQAAPAAVVADSRTEEEEAIEAATAAATASDEALAWALQSDFEPTLTDQQEADAADEVLSGWPTEGTLLHRDNQGGDAIASESHEEERERNPGEGFNLQVKVPPGVTAGMELDVVSPGGQVVRVKVPPGHEAGSCILVRMPGMDEVDNLIDAPISDTRSLKEMEVRVRKYGPPGVMCTKAASNGRMYRRSFWIAGGCLRTNGHLVSGVELRSILAVFRGCKSVEFQRLSKQGVKRSSGIFRKSLSSITGMTESVDADPEEAGCVVVTRDGRSFSLLFDGGSRQRDEFAETVAWCVQRCRLKDVRRLKATQAASRQQG